MRGDVILMSYCNPDRSVHTVRTVPKVGLRAIERGERMSDRSTVYSMEMGEWRGSS